MDYIILLLLIILIILVIISISKNINESNITERLGKLEVNTIKELSEKFVYFNDDMFLLKPLPSEYFFKNNLPCDIWRDNIPYCDELTDPVFEHQLLNDKMLICRHFNKRKVMKENFSKCINLKYGKRNIIK